jgi:HK97 family phage major capsid protein
MSEQTMTMDDFSKKLKDDIMVGVQNKLDTVVKSFEENQVDEKKIVESVKSEIAKQFSDSYAKETKSSYGNLRINDKSQDNFTKDLILLKCSQVLNKNSNGVEPLESIAKKYFDKDRHGFLFKYFEEVPKFVAKENEKNAKYGVKALNTEIGGDGGYMLPEEFAPFAIAPLMANSIFRKLGCPIIQTSAKTLNIRRFNALGEAHFEYEPAPSDVKNEFANSTDKIVSTTKKLFYIGNLSNDIIRRMEPALMNDFYANMINKCSLKEDIAFINGDGSGNSILGIRHAINQTDNVVAQSEGTTISDKLHDLVLLKAILNRAKVNRINPVYMMNSIVGDGLRASTSALTGEVPSYLQTLYNTPTTLIGCPEGESQQINETEVTYVDLGYCYIHQFSNLLIDFSGDVAFDNDETHVRIIIESNLILNHDVVGAVLTGVNWGLTV